MPCGWHRYRWPIRRTGRRPPEWPGQSNDSYLLGLSKSVQRKAIRGKRKVREPQLSTGCEVSFCDTFMAYDSARFDHAPERARSSSRRGSEVVKDEAYRRTPELSRSLFRKRAREVRQTDDSSLTRLVPVHEAGRNVSDRNDCPNPGGPLVVLLEVGLLTYRHVRSKPSHPFDRAMALRIKKERTVANQLGSHADDSGRTVPESHRSSLLRRPSDNCCGRPPTHGEPN